MGLISDDPEILADRLMDVIIQRDLSCGNANDDPDLENIRDKIQICYRGPNKVVNSGIGCYPVSLIM